MTTLVAGASGATGKQLVEQLLNTKQKVKVIVRSPEKLPESWKNNDQLIIGFERYLLTESLRQ